MYILGDNSHQPYQYKQDSALVAVSDEVDELGQLLNFLDLLEDSGTIESSQKKRHFNWAMRFLSFHRAKKLSQFGEEALTAFLEYLVSSSESGIAIQKSAEKSLRFIYKNFLNVEFRNLHVTRRSPRRGFFSHFSKNEAYRLINALPKSTQLIAKVALEVSLQLDEVLFLRVADLDLKNNQLLIRDNNGAIKFKANIPLSLILELKIQSMKVNKLVQDEKERSFDKNESELAILANHLEVEWQYLFPQGSRIENLKPIERLNQFPITLLKDDISQAEKLIKKGRVNSVNYQGESVIASTQESHKMKTSSHRSQKITYVKKRIDELKAMVNQDANSPIVQQPIAFSAKKINVA